MTDGGEISIITKLEVLRDIRSRTMQLEKLRCKIKQEVDIVEKEERCLAEYRSEMDALQREKSEHVELLRLIHADINGMEAIIRQSDDEYKLSKVKLQSLLADYLPIKEQVDELRATIGLSCLSDADIETAVGSHATAAGTAAVGTTAALTNASTKRKLDEPAPMLLSQSSRARSGSSSSDGGDILCRVSVGVGNVLVVVPASTTADATDVDGASDVGRLRVRQQQPPMKLCSTCQQQIHRNAPICPLCKAKSHSRNPKKVKKKE